MRQHKFWKLEMIEDRHPGLCAQVEAMIKASIPVRAIKNALQAQYGVRIGWTCLSEYQWECREVWRAELQG
jgi:hypothetical protein